MAIYHMRINAVTRSTGRTATAAAAYRAGERIRDERTGALYNHSKRVDVLHKEIFLPSSLEQTGAAMDWARDRSRLWNAAEKAELRADSRVAREYQVALPRELSEAQRAALARAFSREIADRYNVAVDLAIHAPRPEGDPRNFHAHLLTTTREVTADGLGAKTGLDRTGEVRSELGLPTARQEFANLRARWAELTNEALREAKVEARVDHRSLKAQGIDREPRPRLPWAALAAERRGERSDVAERIRARYRQRAPARSGKAAEAGADNTAASSAGSARASPEQPSPGSGPVQDMDERRRQAVQEWLQYRRTLQTADASMGAESASPLSMDEVRRRAVEAWRSLRARGTESQLSTASQRGADPGREQSEPDRAGEMPGPGDDFSA